MGAKLEVSLSTRQLVSHDQPTNSVLVWSGNQNSSIHSQQNYHYTSCVGCLLDLHDITGPHVNHISLWYKVS